MTPQNVRNNSTDKRFPIADKEKGEPPDKYRVQLNKKSIWCSIVGEQEIGPAYNLHIHDNNKFWICVSFSCMIELVSG